jgi:hypothetical protein
MDVYGQYLRKICVIFTKLKLNCANFWEIYEKVFRFNHSMFPFLRIWITCCYLCSNIKVL